MSGVAAAIAATVAVGTTVYGAERAKAAASKAAKTEAALAVQYAKGEQKALTAAQIQAQASRKRMIIYVVSGVAGLAVLGTIIYVLTSKKKKRG